MEENGPWVVYVMTIHKGPDGIRAVCSQAEWEAMEQCRPGYHTFVRGGIETEHDAELIARGKSGDDWKKPARTR